MKMVAASKLRRAQARITQARPYADRLARVLADVAARTEHTHPLLEQPSTERVWVVVISSDKGLCGSFNANLLRAAERELRGERWSDAEVVALGRKASDYFRRRRWSIVHEERETMNSLQGDEGRRLGQHFMKEFTAGQVGEVWLCYNRFASLIRHEFTIQRLLPIEPPPADAADEVAVDFLYEPDATTLLAELLPRHVETQIQRSLFDSAAAEQAARMTAMDAATKNAKEMIESLTMLYNRTRQAAITKELIEIVSGAQALGD